MGILHYAGTRKASATNLRGQRILRPFCLTADTFVERRRLVHYEEIAKTVPVQIVELFDYMLTVIVLDLFCRNETVDARRLCFGCFIAVFYRVVTTVYDRISVEGNAISSFRQSVRQSVHPSICFHYLLNRVTFDLDLYLVYGS